VSLLSYLSLLNRVERGLVLANTLRKTLIAEPDAAHLCTSERQDVSSGIQNNDCQVRLTDRLGYTTLGLVLLCLTPRESAKKGRTQVVENDTFQLRKLSKMNVETS